MPEFMLNFGCQVSGQIKKCTIKIMWLVGHQIQETAIAGRPCCQLEAIKPWLLIGGVDWPPQPPRMSWQSGLQ